MIGNARNSKIRRKRERPGLRRRRFPVGSGVRHFAWIRFWHGWVSVVFLKAYLGIAERASFWPGSQAEFQVLLDAHLLEKAVYEIGYELNNRPDWVRIPIRGVLDILEMNSRKAI